MAAFELEFSHTDWVKEFDSMDELVEYMTHLAISAPHDVTFIVCPGQELAYRLITECPAQKLHFTNEFLAQDMAAFMQRLGYAVNLTETFDFDSSQN